MQNPTASRPDAVGLASSPENASSQEGSHPVADVLAEFEDPLSDPVILSFANCLRSGLLCAWRRVPAAALRAGASAATAPTSTTTQWPGAAFDSGTPSLNAPTRLNGMPAVTSTCASASTGVAQRIADSSSGGTSDPWDAELLAGPAVAKELWIYWYGDEPDNLRDVIAPELKGVRYGVQYIYSYIVTHAARRFWRPVPLICAHFISR